MATTKRSGITVFTGTDTVSRSSYNQNMEVIDKAIRYDYREKVDITSWDSTNKVYTKVEFMRPEDGTKHLSCTLSNNVDGNYTTDTWLFYDALGSTVIQTVIWTLTYDANGNIVDKSPAFS